MRVLPIPCLADNYAYLVVCDETREAAVVDASEEEPVARAAFEAGVRLRAIWSTHHHADHVGGNVALAARFGVGEIAGHATEHARIPGLTRPLAEGDAVQVGRVTARALHVPGHTLGAVAYVAPGAVFTGDTLFLAGCGRLFEGTAAMMRQSLAKLAALPDETQVYCGHEYTRANLRFAAHVEPSNSDVRAALERPPTPFGSPGTIGAEKRHNPFLRVFSPELRRTLGIDPAASDDEAFARVREAKNTFR